MKSVAMIKLASSALVMGTVTMGYSPAGMAKRPVMVSDAGAGKQAQVDAAKAQRLLGGGHAREAVSFAEDAVAASPRDAGYRMLLGQVYLASGRLSSAEASFTDTLTLDPERERAALDLALVQTALGKRSDAMRTLADYHDKLPAADFGLAVALAGDPAAAVGILEAAARGDGATAKTRQNLALAYAMAGQWAKARATAQQDLDPIVADQRVLGWASFTAPANPWDQVASLLGVTPVEDAGQPTRLALAPSSTRVAVAAPSDRASADAASVARSIAVPMAIAATDPTPPPMADPSVFETATASTPARTAVADAVADADAVIDASSGPTPDAAPSFEAPVVVAPVIRASRVAAKFAVRAAARSGATAHARSAPTQGITAGRFVVQIGAFSNSANAERAWGGAARRFGLGGYNPVNGSARVHNADLVRVAVSGFETRANADRVCGRIKATGGVCFVRAQAGDALASWVKRDRPTRLASR